VVANVADGTLLVPVSALFSYVARGVFFAAISGGEVAITSCCEVTGGFVVSATKYSHSVAWQTA